MYMPNLLHMHSTPWLCMSPEWPWRRGCGGAAVSLQEACFIHVAEHLGVAWPFTVGVGFGWPGLSHLGLGCLDPRSSIPQWGATYTPTWHRHQGPGHCCRVSAGSTLSFH
jgi:hypothetical protein